MIAPTAMHRDTSWREPGLQVSCARQRIQSDQEQCRPADVGGDGEEAAQS